MAVIIRGKTDAITEQIAASLRPYDQARPNVDIVLYRQNSVSVRIRIIDPNFAELTKPQRSDLVWDYLDRLSDDVQGDISSVLLLTPTEVASSFGNFEFDHPVRSAL